MLRQLFHEGLEGRQRPLWIHGGDVIALRQHIDRPRTDGDAVRVQRRQVLVRIIHQIRNRNVTRFVVRCFLDEHREIGFDDGCRQFGVRIAPGLLNRFDNRRQFRHPAILFSAFIMTDLEDVRHPRQLASRFDTRPGLQLIHVGRVVIVTVRHVVGNDLAVIIDFDTVDDAVTVIIVMHHDRAGKRNTVGVNRPGIAHSGRFHQLDTERIRHQRTRWTVLEQREGVAVYCVVHIGDILHVVKVITTEDVALCTGGPQVKLGFYVAAPFFRLFGIEA